MIPDLRVDTDKARAVLTGLAADHGMELDELRLWDFDESVGSALAGLVHHVLDVGGALSDPTFEVAVYPLGTGGADVLVALRLRDSVADHQVATLTRGVRDFVAPGAREQALVDAVVAVVDAANRLVPVLVATTGS